MLFESTGRFRSSGSNAGGAAGGRRLRGVLQLRACGLLGLGQRF